MKRKSNKRSVAKRWMAITAGVGIAMAGTALPITTAAGAATSGGSLTMLELGSYAGNWPEGLGTYTNGNALGTQSMMNAIYGDLFELGAKGQTVPDLASGYQLSPDAKTLTLTIRKGVVFSDGTPFNAAAVVSNLKADLASPSTANPPVSVASVAATGPLTVVIKLKAPDGAIVNQFQDSLFNWIASPTAEKKLGAKQFGMTPVGAGPFKVVSDTIDSKLVLTKNTKYWKAGYPLLDNLTFETASSDDSALEVLQSGGAQAYEYMDTPQLLSAYKNAGLQVTADKGNAGLDVQINTSIAPFNNIKAREALYYATDNQAIASKVYDNTCAATESYTGPSGLFFEPNVPGYRSYDLAKAKALVKQLGGLSFSLLAQDTGELIPEAEALQTMYGAAGMKVKLNTAADLSALIQDYSSHKWQTVDASIGAWDPADGIGVAFRMLSSATFSGIHDPKVDSLISQGTAATTPAARGKAYDQLSSYLNQQAYTPFICSATTWDIATKGVSGVGLTTDIPGGVVGPQILWETVSNSGS
jgi:peptide/nickel transport system substrate-binding protein